MIGYDLDGVIAVEKDWWNILYRTIPQVAVWLRHRYRPKYIPSGDFIIVTNRPVDDREQTLKWLSRYGIRYSAIYFNIVRDPFGSSFKEKCIKEHGVTKFYESDVGIVKELTMSCPGVEIILC